MRNFKYFFHSCEQGFRNEFIIQLYARVYKPGIEIQTYGHEAIEVVLITSGQVDMLNRDHKRFMALPAHSIFNDYQLLFNLRSNIQFKSHKPSLNKKSDSNATQN